MVCYGAELKLLLSDSNLLNYTVKLPNDDASSPPIYYVKYRSYYREENIHDPTLKVILGSIVGSHRGSIDIRQIQVVSDIFVLHDWINGGGTGKPIFRTLFSHRDEFTYDVQLKSNTYLIAFRLVDEKELDLDHSTSSLVEYSMVLELHIEYAFKEAYEVGLIRHFHGRDIVHSLLVDRGSYHYFSFDIRADAPWNISIGKFCSISKSRVLIVRNSAHRKDFDTTYPLHNLVHPSSILHTHVDELDVDESAGRSLTIGHDVWIGMNSVFINNLTIGHGAVIGAESVVRESGPPYAVVYGNPARIAKYRFDEHTIGKLLQMAWWDWSDDRIVAMTQFEDALQVIDAWEKGHL